MPHSNIHIYYSEMRYESRLFNIISSLEKNEVFKEFILLGRKSVDLEAWENHSPNTLIRRLGLSETHALGVIPLMQPFIWYLHAVFFILRVRPQCLNIHSVSLIPLAVLIKIFRPKTILIYDANELETETNGASKLKKSFRRCIEKVGIKFFQHTVTVSPLIQDWYKQKYNITNVSLIYNFPHSAKTKPAEYLRDKFDLSKDKVIFLYQGILMPGRGVENLVQALESLPKNAVLVLLGYGENFQSLNQAAKVNDRLFVHRAVAYNEILNITASADCGVSFLGDTCLSYHYTLPNKLFEFIQAQIPVIVSPTLAQSNIVTSQKIGVVCEDFSAQALAAACQSFLKFPKGYFDKNLQKAAKQYCWEAQEENLINIYREVGIIKSAK